MAQNAASNLKSGFHKASIYCVNKDEILTKMMMRFNKDSAKASTKDRRQKPCLWNILRCIIWNKNRILPRTKTAKKKSKEYNIKSGKSASHEDIAEEICSDEKNVPSDEEILRTWSEMIQSVRQKMSLNQMIINYLTKTLYPKKIGFWQNDQVLYFYQDTLEKLPGSFIKLLNSYGFSQLHLLTWVNGDNNSHWNVFMICLVEVFIFVFV